MKIRRTSPSPPTSWSACAKEIDGQLKWLFFPEQCRHCIEPPCLETADDEAAIYKDEKPARSFLRPTPKTWMRPTSSNRVLTTSREKRPTAPWPNATCATTA
jgi:hypothetical protein